MTTHYRQLTQGQRYQIEAGLAAGETRASTAKRVGVHPSTISREIRRNGSQKTYEAVSASRESDARRAGARKFCKPATWLRQHLPLWLEQQMSPEQIAHRLRLERPDQAVSHEWIYRFIATTSALVVSFTRTCGTAASATESAMEATTDGDSCVIARRSASALPRSKTASGWGIGRAILCMA